MSQVSSCEGPPTSMSMMQLMSFLELSTAPSAFSPNIWVTPNPRQERDPACRKSRLRRPSQKWTSLSASRRNMAANSLENMDKLSRFYLNGGVAANTGERVYIRCGVAEITADAG